MCDQILEPSDFPWQGNEAQVVAFEVKERIKSMLQQHLQMEVGVISQQVVESNREARRKLRMETIEEPEDGDEEPEPDEDEEGEEAYA